MRGEFGPGFEDVQRADVGQREDAARRCPAGLVTRRTRALRHLAAHEGHVLHAGHADVGNEHAVAEEMAGILLAQQARADPTYDLLVIAHIFGDPVGYVYAFTLLYARNRCQ